MTWLVVDKDGSELILNGEKPTPSIEYCIHGATKESILLGEEARAFDKLDNDGKITYLLQDLKERPFPYDNINEEARAKLNSGDIYSLTELSYKNNRYLRPIELPKGSIEKLIGTKLTFEDEPFELSQLETV